MTKKEKQELKASNYAINHYEINRNYTSLEVHKMLCDAYIAGNNDSIPEKSASKDLEEAAKEWNRKASFNPIAMTLDAEGNPNGTKMFITSHADSFKAGVKWVIEQLNKL